MLPVAKQLGVQIDRSSPVPLYHQLAEQLGADVVQTIGRTCTLYRENPDLERKKGALPPWR